MSIRRATRVVLVIAIFLVLIGLGLVHAHQHAYDFTGSGRFAWAMAYGAALAITAYGMGLPDVVMGGREATGRAAAALALGALGVSIIQLFSGDALLPRFVVFGALPILFPIYVLATAVATRSESRAGQRDRVLLVGSATEAALLEMDLEMEPERPSQLVGTVAPEDVLGSERHLIEMADAVRASVVVLSREAQAADAIVHQAAHLHEGGVRIRSLSLFYEQWLAKLPVNELERVSLFFDIGEIHRARYARASRLLDITVAAAGIIVLAVAIPFVAVGNVLGNRGPIFYQQSRVGKNGATFQILKFRTMTPSRGGWSPNEWTTEDDPRITSFGRVLRRTHVDELPQLVNILTGDLSVVGPRPEQPHYVQELVEKLPFYELRHLVRPGLTGWAQVKYGYAGNERDALEKLQYEFFYLRHQSLSLDLRCIVRTVRSVIGARGR